MAGTIAVKLYELLRSIGVDVSQQQASNVKKLAPKNKSTATKVGLLAAERDTGGNFATVLDIFKKDAQYINSMNDVEQMAFLNNIMDYKEFGGSSIKNTEGIRALDEAKNLTDESSDLKTAIDNLTNKAKSMKDEAELNVNKAYKDLDDFFETGGDPFKKKDDKFLGGSMSEEGQVRTGIREFLKKEYKNGRINLDKKDIERVMKYSGLSEDDPILVFKKLYGDEAYKKAGSFPGAFDIGENYNQYEEIFRKNMGENILKVKDKKYVGDGTLMLTDEVRTPIKDEDVPFATGGRASFAGGKVIDELVAMLVKKEPMEAMKEVNKIIGKKGKYKNLTQKDIDRIVDQTNDHIFQRDPDNLFVGDRDIDNKKRLLTDDEIRDYEAELGDSETWMMDGTVEEAEKALVDYKDYEAAMKKEYDAASPAERAEVIGSKEPVEDRPMFKKKTLPKIDDKLLKNYNKEIKEGVASIMKDTSPEGLAKSIEIDNLMLKYPGMDMRLADQIASSSPTMKSDMIAMVEQTFELDKQGKSGDEIIDIFKNTKRTEQADGGITQLRNGYYGGGQAMVGEDLSEIGHGSDSLMARNMQLAPNGQATTSTGLNYLLGQDNETVRVPYKDAGPVVLPKAKPKPNADPMVELLRVYNLYQESMPGVSQETQKYLKEDFIQKLNDAGISQEAFMNNRMQNNFADGGRIGYAGGKGVDIARRGFLKILGGSVAAATAFKMGLVKLLGKESGAVSKKAVDEFFASGASGAPTWFEPLVNKALKEGLDITEKAAIKDGQIVKQLDTPTGKVDVTYDTRTGAVDVDYMGGDTAMGEGLQMRYAPGDIIEEGAKKGQKSDDVFEAVETVPEGNMYSPDDYQVEFGENMTSNIDDLYSDTSELKKLGGEKLLVKDISNTLKKKKVLKEMDNNPDQFASDNLPDYDY